MTTDRLLRPHFSNAPTMMAAGLLFACALAAGLSGGDAASAATAPSAASSAASTASGACADGDGVTVVVDFTDLGGSIEAGCALKDPATGRTALLAAGFTAADSQPGLLCTIDSMPNPCPTTFQGSFWSYWHSTTSGEWTSYQVGADASDPAPGELEGWRYNDGSAGPGIAPSAVADTLRPAQTATAVATAAPAKAAPAAGAADSVFLFASLGIAAAMVILVILALVRARRRRASGGE